MNLSSASAFNLDKAKILSSGKGLQKYIILLHLKHCISFRPKRQILESLELKELTDDNFRFDENGGKFSKRVENTMGKGEIATLRAIAPFPTAFLKDLYCRHVKKGLFGKGLKRKEKFVFYPFAKTFSRVFSQLS